MTIANINSLFFMDNLYFSWKVSNSSSPFYADDYFKLFEWFYY